MSCSTEGCLALAKFICGRCRQALYCSNKCHQTDAESHRSRCFAKWSHFNPANVASVPDLRWLFIGGTDSDIPFESLMSFFKQFGDVQHIQKPRSTGWLKVQFGDKLAAIRCLLTKPLRFVKADGKVKIFRTELLDGEKLSDAVNMFIVQFELSQIEPFGSPHAAAHKPPIEAAGGAGGHIGENEGDEAAGGWEQDGPAPVIADGNNAAYVDIEVVLLKKAKLQRQKSDLHFAAKPYVEEDTVAAAEGQGQDDEDEFADMPPLIPIPNDDDEEQRVAAGVREVVAIESQEDGDAAETNVVDGGSDDEYFDAIGSEEASDEAAGNDNDLNASPVDATADADAVA